MYYPTTLRLLSFGLKLYLVLYMIVWLFWWCFWRPKRNKFHPLVTALPAEMQLHVLQYLNKKDRDNFGLAFPWWRRLVDAYRDKLPEYTPEEMEKQQRDKLTRRTFFYRLVIRLHPLYVFVDGADDSLEPLAIAASWLGLSRTVEAILGVIQFLVTGGHLFSESLFILPLVNASCGTPHWWFEFVIHGALFIYKSFMAFYYCLYWYSILYHSLDFGQPDDAAFDRDYMFSVLYDAFRFIWMFSTLFFYQFISPFYLHSL